MTNNNLNNLKNNFLELSQDLMCVAGFDGFFKYVNPAFENLLGYTKKEFLSKPFLEFMHVDDHSRTNLAVSELSKGKVLKDFENRLICKDGSIKRIHWTAAPQVDEKIMHGVGRDITASKHAEEGVIQSNANLNSLTESTNDLVWSIDRDYKLLTANSEFLTYARPLYKKKINIGSLLLDKKELPPELYDDWKEIYDKVLTGNNFKMELETHTRPDNKKYLELNYNPIINDENEITGVSIFGRDISNRKQAEYELRASEEKYKQLFVKLMNAFALHEMLFDENGNPTDYRFLEVNPAWEKIVGIKAEKVINKTIREIMPVIEDSWIQTYGRIVKTGNPEEFEDYNEATKKYYHIYAYRTEPGKFAVLFNDITADKLTAKAIMKAKEKAEESEEKHRFLIENTIQGVVYHNSKGKIIFANKAASEILGLSLEQLYEKTSIDPRWKSILEDGSDYPGEKHPVMETLKTAKPVYNSVMGVFHPEKDNYSWININSIPKFKNNDKSPYQVVVTFEDITKIKNASIELEKAKLITEESEAKFHQMFQFSPDSIIIHDMEMNIIDFNHRALEEFGYQKEEFIKKTVFELHPQDELQHSQKALKKINNQDMVKVETMFVKKDGSTFLAEAIPCKYTIGGKPIIHVVIRNITKQKKAETDLILAKEKAEENEIKFKAAFFTNPDAVNINKMNGEYVEINEGFTHLTGYTKDDVIGKLSSEINIWSIPKDRQKLINALRKFGIIENLESMFRTKNGNLIPALMSAKIITLKNEPHILSVTRDITERKKLEKIKDILVAISNEILTTNDLEEFFHHIFIELREIIDTNNFYIALYDEQSEMISTPYIADTLDTSITCFSAKKTLTGHVIKTQKSMFIDQANFHELAKSGVIDLVGPQSDIWIGVPLFSGEKVIGVIVIQNYKGEKRLNREDLRVLEYVAPQISLAIERKKVVENLKDALVKAKESDRLKSAFLANMSHEIRTPMNGILGFTELLKEPGLSGKEQQKYIGIIESSGDRMLNTIHDIIDISKIESGQAVLTYSNINLNELMDDLFEFFLPETKSKNIQLSITKKIAKQYATIKTDKDKLNSIITNLIKNAIKFTDSGKIEFGYLVDEKAKKPEFLFYVKDTGVGVTKEKQKVIFDRFVQADNEHTRVYEGSGLGLAISKAYVEMLKGKIWLESEEGVGSQFYFTHPYHITKNRLKDIVNPSRAKFAEKTLKILIAEDEKFAVEFLSVILKDYCKEILVANTGLEVVEMCRKNPDIDLIMMDIRLPEINGYEATKQIRKFNKEVFIIAQTAFALAGDRERAIKAGCNDYIAKPIKKERLFEIITNQFLITDKEF